MENPELVVGVFNSAEEAYPALVELKQAGFTDDRLGFLMKGAEFVGPGVSLGGIGHPVEGSVAEGGAAGSVLGGILGGLATGLIPGVGPVIAAGVLSAVLAGAVAGGTTGGILGGLIGLGIPKDTAQSSHQEFEAGRAIVTARATGRPEDVRAILQRHGAYDVHLVPGGAAYQSEMDRSPLGPPSWHEREIDRLAHDLNEKT